MPVIDPKYTKGHITEGSIFTWIGNLFKKKEVVPLTPVPPAHKYDPLTFVTPTAQYYNPDIPIKTPTPPSTDLSFGSLAGDIKSETSKVLSRRYPIQNYIIIGAALFFMFFIVYKTKK